jgi:hypothetical protein
VWAAFCWIKSLLCNVAAFKGLLLYPESTLQLCSSRRFCEVFKDLFRFPVTRPDDVVFRPDAHQLATSVRTTRSSRPDAHLSTIPSVRMTCHPVRTLDRPASSVRKPYCIEKFLCQLASVRTFQQHVRTPPNTRSVFDFFPSSKKGKVNQPSGRCGIPS